MKIRISDSWRFFFVIILFVSAFSSLSNVRRLDGFVIAEPLLNIGILKNLFPMLGLSCILLLITKRALVFNVEKIEFPLFISLFVFSLTPIISTLFGVTQDIDFRILLYPICIILVFKYSAPHRLELVNFVYRILTIYLIVNIIILFLVPYWALQHGYTIGWIEGLTVRLYGISGHPNNISSIMLLYVFFTIFNQSIGVKTKVLSIFCAFFLILISQSKTIMLILFVSFLYLFYLTIEKHLNKQLKAFYKGVVALLLLMFFAVFFFSLGNYESFLIDTLGQARFNRLSTLTGRDVIWKITLEQFYINPIFGYGPGLYEQKSLFLSRLGFTPGHAHNQIFQTIGETGLLGLFSLSMVFVFLYKLIFIEIKNDILLKVLFLALFLRMITQSVFRGGFDEVFLFQMILLVLLRSSIRSKEL